MRTTRPRPASQHGAQSPYTQLPAPPSRKIFNCIVDDTALVAGVKRSTRNGIRQWVKNGQIRLFVPLHALELLGKQKGHTNRHGEDVRETLQWLDDATNKYPAAVTLQGGDQYFSDWNEVERFAVPRTLFSEHDHVDVADAEPEPDESPETTHKLPAIGSQHKSVTSSANSVVSGSASPSSLHSMRSSISPVSPPTSPTKAASSPAQPLASLNCAMKPSASSSSIVPARLQSLFNYILWRIHQELDPAAALESFVFLCNDPNKVHYSRGFDIRSKRLEQLRETVGREDRDFRNRQSMQNRENQPSVAALESKPSAPPEEDEDDEVVFKPATPRHAAATVPLQTNVIDPNAFSRTTLATIPTEQQEKLQSPRLSTVHPNQTRGSQTTPSTPRGNTRAAFRGTARGRAHVIGSRGAFVPTNRVPSTTTPSAQSPAQSNGQIDPDSFARPRGSGYTGRGGRKLWVPT